MQKIQKNAALKKLREKLLFYEFSEPYFHFASLFPTFAKGMSKEYELKEHQLVCDSYSTHILLLSLPLLLTEVKEAGNGICKRIEWQKARQATRKHHHYYYY